jgi:uncharacterized protein
MQNQFDPRMTAAPGATVGVPSVARDAGLRSYMLSVYNYMASGVLLTGIVALVLAQTGVAQTIFFGGGILKWVAIFAPLVVVMIMAGKMATMSTSGARTFFFAFAALMGVSMSVIPLIYSGTSIAQTFFATAVAFLGLSLVGYTTKKDLSGMGTFLIMGVWGLIAVSILNMFMRSSGLSLIVSFVGVLLFAGLTAYDTQQIKSMYGRVAGSDMVGKTAIMGALKLYLDFINMFQFLLSFMGDRR